MTVSRGARVCNTRGSACAASLNRTLSFGQIMHDSHHDTSRHRMSNDCAHRVDSREIKRSDSSLCNIQRLVGHAHGEHSHAVHMIRYAMIPQRVITHKRACWGEELPLRVWNLSFLCCVRDDQLHPRTEITLLSTQPVRFCVCDTRQDEQGVVK